jgi:hypothetical protein
LTILKYENFFGGVLMALVYCIDLKAGDLKAGSVCVPILKKIPWPWELWVEMLRRVEDPAPVPWVLDEQLDQIIMQDLAVLAAIDQLADSLSLNARRGAKQYIKKAIEEVELPQGRRVQHR